MLIAGDIGGTKTDLAIFLREAGPHAPIAELRVRSADYPSLEEVVKELLANTQVKVDSACFAAAWPVIEERAKMTNLPWVIDENSLAQELNLDKESIHVMNDLEAIARAVPILRPNDVVTINNGKAIAQGTIAVIAPGTGLGGPSSLGMGRGIKLIAPKAVTPISLHATNGKSACSNTCLRSSIT